MPTIVYDTGALLAAERRNPDFLALHDELTAARIRPLAPVVVLAQPGAAAPSTRSHASSKAATVLPDDQHIGRAAGVSPAPPPGPLTSWTRSSSPPLCATKPPSSPATRAT